MTIGTKSFRTPILVSNSDFATDVHVARVRHQQIPVAKSAPLIATQIPLGIQPFPLCGGDVATCALLYDEVEFPDFFLVQASVDLDVEEPEDTFAKVSFVGTKFSRTLVGISDPSEIRHQKDFI